MKERVFSEKTKFLDVLRERSTMPWNIKFEKLDLHSIYNNRIHSISCRQVTLTADIKRRVSKERRCHGDVIPDSEKG